MEGPGPASGRLSRHLRTGLENSIRGLSVPITMGTWAHLMW